MRLLNTATILWRILLVLVAVLWVHGQNSEDENVFGQLPFCGGQDKRMSSHRLIYVSTLDGKITALDIAKGGSVYWRLPTDPGALISSCIHRLDLTSNGQFVRMIPSLSGGIYKFNGVSVELIPVTPDNLLSSSFKFSDDLVISGGKESRSYGISARTGQILYECSMKGCVNTTDPFLRSNDSDAASPEDHFISEDDHNPEMDDVIVIRRQTQTVSAADCRTGNVRWNFSVAQHELEFVKSTACHDRPLTDLDLTILDIDFRAIVPEGIIYAFSTKEPSIILWEHKFDHPIVSVWKMGENGILKPIDLFNISSGKWPDPDNEHLNININPYLYVGIYREQLYIQESPKHNDIIRQLDSTETIFPKVPWKPVSAKITSLTKPIFKNDPRYNKKGDNDLLQIESNNRNALAMLYDVNIGGVFLYTESDLNKTVTALCKFKNNETNTTGPITEEFGFPFGEETDTPVKFVVVSLWFWWKEILVISLTSATLLNLLFTSRIRREREIVVIERHIPVPTAIEAKEEEQVTIVDLAEHNSNRTISESNSQCGDNFTSRFQSDFDLYQCLGKGGFGVVFEAKNKLDGCMYAVKRITLPVKKESRERVMREVKTLAKCEHHNIVRYFQAWVEAPPHGWQEVEDTKWLAKEMSVDIESTTLPTYNTNKEIISGNYNESESLDDLVIESKSHTRSQSYNQSHTGSGDCVSIDTHMNDNSCNLDCTNLSDSFEIEFIDSTDDKNKLIRNGYMPSRTYQSYSRVQAVNSSSCSHGSSQALVPLKATSFAKVQNKVFLYIQMQLCQKQSLRDWLREHKLEMRKPHTQSIFEQIVDAVVYVHSKKLIHRDLKPSNIFFSLNGQIKIGDFGLVTDTPDMPNSSSQSYGEGSPVGPYHTEQVGTHLYMSPEQLQGMHYDLKVDIFSLGLIFFELLMYFGTEMERIETLKAARERKFPQDFDYSFPNESSLLKMMLSNLPEMRPQADEIKRALLMAI